MKLDRCFEALDPRTLLDGVAGVVAHAYTTPTALYLQVEYTAEAPISLQTLGNDDLRVTRVSGSAVPFSSLATLVGEPTLNWNGGARALYKVDAPNQDLGQWRFGTDNGAYVVSLEAGSIGTTAGQSNAAADLRTLNLWFNTPVVEFTPSQLNVLGVGYPPGPLPPDAASMDEARVLLGYRIPTAGGAIRGIQVTLTGPNGYTFTLKTTPEVNSFSSDNGTLLSRLVLKFPVPKSASNTSSNGTWDYADVGTYNLTVRFAPTLSDPSPVSLLQREYNVVSAAPQGEMANVAVNDDHLLVTMRYSFPLGLVASTIGDGDIKASIPGSGVVSGTLMGPATEAGGIFTAIYRVNAPVGGWSSVPTGKVLVRTALNAVLTPNGYPLGFALTREVDASAAGRVTGLVTDSYTTATKLVMVVRYSSDQPIDSTTLGDGDVRLTGPGGYSKLGHLVQTVMEPDGSVRAVYHFTPNSSNGMWDFRTDNGTYIATLLAGEVNEINGSGATSEAVLKTYGLWFQTPVAEVVEAAAPWHADAEFYTYAYDGTDAGRIVVRYITKEYQSFHLHHLSAQMVGPSGQIAQLIPDRSPLPYRSVPSGFEQNVVFHFSPPGGGWDYSDNGRYTITVYLNPGGEFNRLPGQPVQEAIFVREFDVNIATPRADIVSTAITSDAMLVTLRYQSPSGINHASIGNGDVGLVLRRRWSSAFTSQVWNITGTLVGTPAPGQSGSLTATYRIGSLNGGPWQAYEFATVIVRPEQVSDNAGNFIGMPALTTFEMPEAQPDVIGTGTMTVSRSAWDVEVSFRNPGDLIDISSIRPQNLIVTAPGGRAVRVSVVSVTEALDGTLRARYRIMPQLGTLRLFSGTYTLTLAPNSVSQGAAGALRVQPLGSFNMVFP